MSAVGLWLSGAGRTGNWGLELGRWAGGLGDDQAGAAALGDLADGVPALGAQRVGPLPALRPQRIVVAVNTQPTERDNHIRQTPQPGMLPGVTQAPARRG